MIEASVLEENMEAKSMSYAESQTIEKNPIAKRALLFASACVLALAVLAVSPMRAYADPVTDSLRDQRSGVVAEPLAAGRYAGPFSVAGGTENVDYAYSGGVLTVKSSTPLTISMSITDYPTRERIVIDAGAAGANVTLDSVLIDIGADGDRTSPIKVMPGTSLNLEVRGESKLSTAVSEGENGPAALHVPSGAGLKIDGDGVLECTSAAGAAIGGSGIVGSGENDAGTITINGGTVNAYGGAFSAAIGGGHGGGDGGVTTINGGRYTPGRDNTEPPSAEPAIIGLPLRLTPTTVLLAPSTSTEALLRSMPGAASLALPMPSGME